MKYTVWQKGKELVAVREDGECFNLVPTKKEWLDERGDVPQGAELVCEFTTQEAKMECPNCGWENPTIDASHHYSIVFNYQQGKYVKEVGDVFYVCMHCHGELDVSDIEDVLKSVDEL